MSCQSPGGRPGRCWPAPRRAAGCAGRCGARSPRSASATWSRRGTVRPPDRWKTDAMPSPVIAVVGSTAAGKSEFSLALARSLDGEIINADSMQLYRGMDIGTAKLRPAERAGVPHHLLDIWDVTKSASVVGVPGTRAGGPGRDPVARTGPHPGRRVRPLCPGRHRQPHVPGYRSAASGTGWRASWRRSARRRCTPGWRAWIRPPQRPSCPATAAG